MTDQTELKRLRESSASQIPWKKWGPYLSERQWGTVREDYSTNGDAWNYFPHDHVRSRAYRWGEDGLGESVTTTKYCASRWRSGMAMIRYSRNDYSD